MHKLSVLFQTQCELAYHLEWLRSLYGYFILVRMKLLCFSENSDRGETKWHCWKTENGTLFLVESFPSLLNGHAKKVKKNNHKNYKGIKILPLDEDS